MSDVLYVITLASCRCISDDASSYVLKRAEHLKKLSLNVSYIGLLFIQPATRYHRDFL